MCVAGRTRNRTLVTIGLLMGPLFSTAAAQGQVYTYPNAGQTQEVQSRDRFECHQWAVAQTGFDPSAAVPLPAQAYSPAPPPDPRQGYSDRPKKRGFLGLGDGGFFEGSGVVGDAATGAAVGAAGGAIAGDAGQGAVIGALASTAFGLLSSVGSKTSEPEPQGYVQQQQAQQQAVADQQHMERLERVEAYNRAFGACMTSRDYTVN